MPPKRMSVIEPTYQESEGSNQMYLQPYARGEIRDGRLQFASSDDWENALSHGVFYLKSPAGIDYSAGFRFCEMFYLERTQGEDDPYKGFKSDRFDGSVLGYSDTGSDQVERFQMELHLWERYLPLPVVSLLHSLNELARVVVCEFFDHCGVNPHHIAQITGGINTNEALQYCIFNNFDSKKVAADGFTPHKDSGFIQLMYINESGLEIREGDRWVPLEPASDCLIAIMGHSLEILTARMATKAMSAYHRVRSIDSRTNGQKDRTSFGVYIGPKFEQDLYQYDEAGNLSCFQSFMAFQRKKAIEMGYEFHPALDAAV